MLASLCGFGSWDIMTYAMEALPRTPVDEMVSAEIVQARLKNHLRVLVDQLGLQPPFAIFILEKINPTSGQELRPFTMADEISLTANHRRAIESFVEEFAESELGHEYAESFNPSRYFDATCEPNRTAIALSLCGDAEPQLWPSILDEMGWQFHEGDDDVCPDIDESSFVVQDKVLGSVPVYVTPLSRPPVTDGEEIDRAWRLQRAACVGDFMAHWKSRSQVALVLMRWPQIKEHDGRTYVHAGSAYFDERNEWKDLLFNFKCTSVSKLLELNDPVEDIHKGHPALEDGDCAFGELATLCLSGFELFEMESEELSLIRAVDTKTGWIMQRFIEDE